MSIDFRDMFIICAVGLVLSACTAGRITTPSPSSPPPSAPPQVETTPPGVELPSSPAPEEPDPRIVASLEFTGQGKSLLAQGRPDAAISALERAVNLNPANGRNYYFLSEAWLSKGNISQAREFNHLAGIYFQEDPEWLARVEAQKARIDRAAR